MQAVWPDHRSKHFLVFSVHVPDNDFHISPRTAVVHLLKLRVEYFFLFVGSFLVWAVHVDDVVVEETALYHQLTHPLVDQLPPDHTILHLASHYEASSQFVGCAVALVERGVGFPALLYLLFLPAKLLQCYNVEVAGL